MKFIKIMLILVVFFGALNLFDYWLESSAIKAGAPLNNTEGSPAMISGEASDWQVLATWLIRLAQFPALIVLAPLSWMEFEQAVPPHGIGYFLATVLSSAIYGGLYSWLFVPTKSSNHSLERTPTLRVVAAQFNR